jgi:hypothetical protein
MRRHREIVRTLAATRSILAFAALCLAVIIPAGCSPPDAGTIQIKNAQDATPERKPTVATKVRRGQPIDSRTARLER